MTIQEFGQKFHALVEQAIQSNIPAPAIILQLEMSKLELGYMHIDAMRAFNARRVAQDFASQTPKIITPNTN